MSSKRSHDDSEEPSSSKRQLSQLEIAIEIEEKLKSNKRKVDSIGAVNCETHPKSPKKSSAQADSEPREVDFIEIIDDVAETLKTVTNEAVPIIRSLPSVPSPVRSDTRVHRWGKFSRRLSIPYSVILLIVFDCLTQGNSGSA